MTTRRIGQHVKGCYDRLFGGKATPSAGLPIHRGKALAALLHYPLEILNDLPDHIWDCFLPCGNPLPHLRPSAGEKILNLGSGIGIDSLALVRGSASPIHVVNLDVVPGALFQFKTVAPPPGNPPLELRESSISCVCAEGDRLPFRSGSFDWILMNGVFNLFIDKERLLLEVQEVLKVGGRLVVMDLCAAGELPEYFKEEMDGWAWCMSGACTPSRLSRMVEASGLTLELFSEIDKVDLLHPMGLVARKSYTRG
jgi:SAM-dependent methyltransferase